MHFFFKQNARKKTILVLFILYDADIGVIKAFCSSCLL